MKKRISRVLLGIIAISLLSAALAGCGQSGPLYMPGQQPKEKNKALF